MKLNENDHEILRMLVTILQESQNPVAIAVAAHDLGEYVRYYPRGKKWVEYYLHDMWASGWMVMNMCGHAYGGKRLWESEWASCVCHTLHQKTHWCTIIASLLKCKHIWNRKGSKCINASIAPIDMNDKGYSLDNVTWENISLWLRWLGGRVNHWFAVMLFCFWVWCFVCK